MFPNTILQNIYEQLGVSSEMNSPKVSHILNAVKPYSMVHETGIAFTIASVIYVIKQSIPGVFVECGVWRGGCSVAMLLAQREFFGRISRPVYMLDSFEGLPPVDSRDGRLAAAWQSGAQKEKYFDNCRAAVEDLHDLLSRNKFEADNYKIINGWFNDTVALVSNTVKDLGVAILRLDADWYASTYTSLQYLCPITREEGVVIIDDYYAWDGCARAVHDFLSQNDIPYRIKSLPYNFGAYFIKRLERRNFNEF
jgi:O-methyltransferase